MQGRMVDMTDKEWLVRNLNKGSKDFLHLAKKVNNVVVRDNGEVDEQYRKELIEFIERSGFAFNILLETYKMIKNNSSNSSKEPLIRYVDTAIIAKLIKDKLPNGLSVDISTKDDSVDIYITYKMIPGLTLADHLQYYNNAIESDLGSVAKFIKFNKKFNKDARFGIIGFATIPAEDTSFKKWICDECKSILAPKYPGREIDVKIILGDD